MNPIHQSKNEEDQVTESYREEEVF